MHRPDASILVVEDEPMIQDLLQRQLVILGYTSVDFAENGKRAVQMARQKRYHIILMDVMMPEVDGLEATRLIRDGEKEGETRTPIVAMTGIGDRSQCLGAGMDDFLQKPVMLAPLQERLRKWLKELAADAAAFGPEAGTRETTSVEADKKVDAFQNRIDELRRRFGLES